MLKSGQRQCLLLCCVLSSLLPVFAFGNPTPIVTCPECAPDFAASVTSTQVNGGYDLSMTFRSGRAVGGTYRANAYDNNGSPVPIQLRAAGPVTTRPGEPVSMTLHARVNTIPSNINIYRVAPPNPA